MAHKNPLNPMGKPAKFPAKMDEKGCGKTAATKRPGPFGGKNSSFPKKFNSGKKD